MLIVKRKVGDKLQIGTHVRVQVLGVIGGRVRLGIEAPIDISVRRLELDVIQNEERPETCKY